MPPEAAHAPEAPEAEVQHVPSGRRASRLALVPIGQGPRPAKWTHIWLAIVSEQWPNCFVTENYIVKINDVAIIKSNNIRYITNSQKIKPVTCDMSNLISIFCDVL